mmetsp:Transcript_23272/g.35679  ORF Transcript_23272/g.35679 Transcript_23272/m.35679 type:complete len:305 (-) Transcript_23272:113-1027(-)
MPAVLRLTSSAAAAVLTLLLLSVRSVSSVLVDDNNDFTLERSLQLNSNVTILNDGAVHAINEKFYRKSFHVRNTTLILENGGEIVAAEDWPGIRLVTSSTFNMKNGGIVQGWQDTPAVELHNGQSSDDTASFADIYGGAIIGGKSVDGVGGDAFYVHGFGTKANIFGGLFMGGIGQDDNMEGLSIIVQNFASVHIYSGSFQGEMEVGKGSNIIFYGCFLQYGATITGEFVDGTQLDVVVKTKNDGKVSLIAVSEQVCDTQPSMQPTGFPTISPRPTPAVSYGKMMRPSLVSASILLTVLLAGLS